MKKLYEKNELSFAIVWIVIYCALQSIANPLNKMIGIDYLVSAVFCILQAIVLLIFIIKNNLIKRYRFSKPSASFQRFLFYIPLIILASGNLWNGVAINYSVPSLISRIICMFFVGFLEELIFRGFLFVSIAEKNIKSAIIISSITFGIGHIINLFNGSGMDLVNNLCQIAFAIAIGFLLVIIFYRGGSIIPCIAVHSAINIAGTFSNESSIPMTMQIHHIGILIMITLAYTLLLLKLLPKNQFESKNCD